MTEIINPSHKDEKVLQTAVSEESVEKIYKFKNNIWNKILGPSDFENFNDKEYFRWLEIYKDAKKDLSNVNPVSIEQKMALIEVINGRMIPIVMNTQRSISADIKKLNIVQLRKLQTHMRKFDLSSKVTRSNLDDFAADLLLILKGPPTSLLEYFTTKKTARMNERLMRIVQEDMLLIGLKGMVERIPEKESHTRFEKAKYIVKKIFHYKIWKYLVMPYDLPWIERVKIPEELLEKILIDGLDAHDQELIGYLQKQNMIDHYERFRKVYKPLAFSVGFYFYYDKFNNSMSGKLHENQEEEKQDFLEDFKNLSEAIAIESETSIKSEEARKQEQFQRVLKAFKEKYLEEPTMEEYEEMKAKIFGT